MNRFARYVLAASALKNTSTPCKPCTFAQYGTATATTTAAVGPWLAARFGRQHLLASGVAAVVSTMGVVLASSAACEDATPLQQLHLRMLRQWLTDNGACVDALEFCTAQDKGNGAFATDSIVKKYGGNAVTRWLRRLNPFATPTVATFHERTIINAATIREDGLLGDVIARHLDAGNISQEEAVRLWLIMHRAMGAHSPYHAYLQSLPAAFSTPMHYSESELAELAGTPLFYAAQARNAQVRSSWEGVQPVLRELQARCGPLSTMASLHFTAADWQWATSTFAARSVALPVGEQHPGQEVRSLVPGLDMLNHSAEPTCFWKVTGDLAAGTADVQLRCTRRVKPREELTICYGEEGNEALLFRYGFVHENNKHDSVMLRCPLGPPGEWDERMQSKVKLLRKQGLAARFALPRSEGRLQQVLPDTARRVLQILVMTEKEIDAMEGSKDLQSSGLSCRERLGIDLAVYTSFCKLLVLHLDAMEGAEGTGPLDDDLALIQKGRDAMGRAQWDCLVYRAGQKRILRQYLHEANAKLVQVTEEMKECMQRSDT